MPASAAKVASGDAAYLAARTALQVHGAVGYTQELDLSLWITKVRALVTRVGHARLPPGPGPGGSRLMEVALTEDQQELAGTLRALLAKQADSGAVRAAMASESGYDEALWTTLTEQIGVAALAVPEKYDGVGASLMETAVALEEIGRSLAPSPLLASAIATAALLLHGSDEQRAELLPRIAAGTVATVVIEPPLVLEPAAEIVLVPRGDALERADDRPEARPALDPTLRLGHLDTDAEPSQPLRDVAAALATALQVGAAQRGLDMSVAYAKERVQFGRPIGSFQALKHRMADMLVLVEMAPIGVVGCLRHRRGVRHRADRRARRILRLRAAVAKAYCSDALEKVAGETVQLHGGIAITWEHDAHLVLKRAHALGQLFGPARAHRASLHPLTPSAHPHRSQGASEDRRLVGRRRRPARRRSRAAPCPAVRIAGENRLADRT